MMSTLNKAQIWFSEVIIYLSHKSYLHQTIKIDYIGGWFFKLHIYIIVACDYIILWWGYNRLDVNLKKSPCSVLLSVVKSDNSTLLKDIVENKKREFKQITLKLIIQQSLRSFKYSFAFTPNCLFCLAVTKEFSLSFNLTENQNGMFKNKLIS
jgi:hypothetical protein